MNHCICLDLSSMLTDMKTLIIINSIMNVLFIIMHELEACSLGEWKMFKFLRIFKDRTQYLIFLYVHIPLILFTVYYLWIVFNFNHFILWIIWNSLMIIHAVIHIIARKWKSNVFHSIHSYIFITGAGMTGIINLLLAHYY